jgi:putative CocE/NonD family hydrolase
VRHLRDVEIPTSAGVLRADLFLPEPLPAPTGVVLEYLPYRKDDRSRPRWDVHVELARSGLVGCRLDVPGTGYSAGSVENEYSETELAAGVEAIAWLSRRSWSNGRVGMFGSSYGGFNTLATAMRRPEALRAVAVHAVSDDRYAADAHYWGGGLLPVDLAQYGSLMLALNAAPPLRLGRPDRLDLWRPRLDTRPWLFDWLAHQRDDDFWGRGAIRSDWSDVDCPVLWLGGWHDAYTGGLLRGLERLAAPARGVVGPWLHSRPDEGSVLGPQADYLGELLRHFETHLTGDGGCPAPVLRYFRMTGRDPVRSPRVVEGEWRSLERMPSGQDELVFHLGAGSLGSRPARAGRRRWQFDAAVGTSGGAWCPGAGPVGVAADQAEDNARSLCYDAPPTTSELELFGSPRLRVAVAAGAPVAFISAKLCLLLPGGASLLLARGFLNLTRRDGLDTAEPLAPGEAVEVELELSPVAFRLARGARLRLALSGADFPTVWPAPYASDLEVRHGVGATLSLPLLDLDASDPDPGFPPPREKHSAAEVRKRAAFSTQLGRDVVRVRFGEGSELAARPHEEFRKLSSFDTSMAVSLDRPGRARLVAGRRIRVEEEGAVTETHASFRVRSDERELAVDTLARVREDGELVAERRFAERFARDLL